MDAKTDRQVLAEGKFLRLVNRSHWEWVERTNTSEAAMIAALTATGQMVLVEQFRIPMQCQVIELPAGLSGDDPGTEGEELIAAARRELYEETGYRGDDWQFCTRGPASPGLATEVYSLFAVRGVKKTGPGGGDDRENIEVHCVPLDELDAWLEAKRQSGAQVDPRVYIGRYFLERR